MKMQTSRRSVTDLYPKCSWVLREFLRQFTNVLIQIVLFDWLQSCSSVGLRCASLSLHTAYLSLSNRSIYNYKSSMTVKRTWTADLRFKMPPKNIDPQKILPNPISFRLWVGFLFLSVFYKHFVQQVRKQMLSNSCVNLSLLAVQSLVLVQTQHFRFTTNLGSLKDYHVLHLRLLAGTVAIRQQPTKLHLYFTAFWI